MEKMIHSKFLQLGVPRFILIDIELLNLFIYLLFKKKTFYTDNKEFTNLLYCSFYSQKC